MAEGSASANTNIHKFKLVSSMSNMEPLFVEVPSDACFADIAEQVRVLQQLPADQYVRIIAAGKEKHMDEPVTSVQPGIVLHYTVAAGSVPPSSTSIQARPTAYTSFSASFTPELRASPQQRPTDLLDLAEPGTVLLWVFGGVLALLWLCGLCFSRMFDRTSIIIIGMMTMAFLLPFGLTYLPVGAILRPGARRNTPANLQDQQQQHHHQDQNRDGLPPVYQSGAGQYSVDSGYVPPRPRARVKPGQPLK